MTEYIAKNKAIEVNGTTIWEFVDGLGDFKRMELDILEKSGLTRNIIEDENTWYYKQKWIDAVKEIEDSEKSNLISI